MQNYKRFYFLTALIAVVGSGFLRAGTQVQPQAMHAGPQQLVTTIQAQNMVEMEVEEIQQLIADLDALEAQGVPAAQIKGFRQYLNSQLAKKMSFISRTKRKLRQFAQKHPWAARIALAAAGLGTAAGLGFLGYQAHQKWWATEPKASAGPPEDMASSTPPAPSTEPAPPATGKDADKTPAQPAPRVQPTGVPADPGKAPATGNQPAPPAPRKDADKTPVEPTSAPGDADKPPVIDDAETPPEPTSVPVAPPPTVGGKGATPPPPPPPPPSSGERTKKPTLNPSRRPAGRGMTDVLAQIKEGQSGLQKAEGVATGESRPKRKETEDSVPLDESVRRFVDSVEKELAVIMDGIDDAFGTLEERRDRLAKIYQQMASAGVGFDQLFSFDKEEKIARQGLRSKLQMSMPDEETPLDEDDALVTENLIRSNSLMGKIWDTYKASE